MVSIEPGNQEGPPGSLTGALRDIVVIGASRGGVEALRGIVAALPPNLQSTLLIVVHSSRAFVVMGLFGAALIYGAGIITPAISVLSALEGVA